MDNLPDGFVDLDRGTSRVIATRLELDEMVALLAPATRETIGDAVDGGRGGTRKVTLPGGRVVYLRHYLRGGLVRHFIRDRFLLRPPRPLRELIVTHRAAAAGCRVPRVHAVAIEESGPFYRGWIVTAAVPVAATFAAALASADEPERRELLAQAAAAIREQHDVGIYHCDLTGENLLLDRDGEIVTIDFDLAQIAEPGHAKLSLAGLNRFWRSLTKLAGQNGFALEADDRRWLDLGYSEGVDAVDAKQRKLES